MASIDTTKRKPRRTQGTPSFKYRNRFAYAVLAVGAALFSIWSLTPMQSITNEKTFKLFSVTPEEEKDRKALFEFAAPRRAEFIRETIEEAEALRVER